MATYQINVRNETDESPHIIIYDPNVDPNASDPPTPWFSLNPPSGQSVPFTYSTGYDVLRVAGARDFPAAGRRARRGLSVSTSSLDLGGVLSADLVVRGSASEGFSFDLRNIRRR